MDTTQLLGNPDGQTWAHAFVRTREEVTLATGGEDIADDVETMHTWFANAIESGKMAARPDVPLGAAPQDAIQAFVDLVVSEEPYAGLHDLKHDGRLQGFIDRTLAAVERPDDSSFLGRTVPDDEVTP